jgi:SPASM domain peptide maturase of grasp-with-spasm system
VLGAKNAILCDLFRERYVPIPLTIATAFHHNRHVALEEPAMHDEDFRNFLYVLEQDDWGHFTEIPFQFPALNLQYDYNGKISNCILDIEERDQYPVEKTVRELNLLDCHAVQVRFFKTFPMSYIREVLQYFQDTTVRYVEILLPYDEGSYTEENLKEILEKQVRLKNIYLFSAPKDEIVTFTKAESGHKWRVIYSTKQFRDETACGQVSKGRFTVNLINFTESTNFNSCLNCKVGIDKNGNIKNCPSFKKSMGNVKTTSLKDVVDTNEFKSFFSIRKDDVRVCRDCEFRYICTDCRVYTTNEKDIYAKPSKCSYDPYLGVWVNQTNS